MKDRAMKARRGAVLIVVLGVLVVMALLATTFATLQNIQRSVAKNYLDDVRARLLAISGIEYAVSEIRDMAARGFFSSGPLSKTWIYWGDDVDEKGDQAALLNKPIEWAKNPSFAYEDQDSQDPSDAVVKPKLIKVKKSDGSTADIGFTNAFESGTYAPRGDVYTLKVSDMSGMIYVNDGVHQYGGNSSAVSRNLRRILNNLGKHSVLGLPAEYQNLGDLIVTNRPVQGYRSKEELRKVVNYDDSVYDKFKDFVTAHAWVDKNVALPVPLSGAMVKTGAYDFPGTTPWETSLSQDPYYRTTSQGAWNGLNKIYRRGRGADWNQKYHYSEDGAAGITGVDVAPFQPLQWYQASLAASDPQHNAVYALDELFPSYIEVAWRAPVNVNTAPEPVLTALLADVSGFFLVERRRFAPHAGSPESFSFSGPGYGGSNLTFTVPKQYYTWEYAAHTYDAQGAGGDEMGYLYRTAPLVGPWAGTVSGSVSAQAIANHILACRSKGTYGGIDYAAQPFGGPFKTWAQFNAFLDYLVSKSVIVDSRAIFTDYTVDLTTLNSLAVSSSVQRGYAAQALVDALKANFNPNLHLNETNPDANLFLRVDKTDLIVHSTEFCFTSMGYYEIEALGRVLQPQEGIGYAADASSGNQVVAEKKIVTVIKLFDAYRESTQRHFYPGGGLIPKSSSSTTETNNNMSLEIGPEPDNGPLVYGDTWQGYTTVLKPEIDGYAGYVGTTEINTGWGYEYDGTIALATLGGFDLSTTSPVAKKSGDKLVKGLTLLTPQGSLSEGLGSTIHSHFVLDHRAHYHQSAVTYNDQNFREECGTVIMTSKKPPLDTLDTNYNQSLIKTLPRRERTLNFGDRRPDLPVPPASPYNPTYGSARHRLARSFRMPLQPSSGTTVSLPTLPPFEPSDLRLDGAYSERHSGIAYWVDNNISFSTLGGVVSFWAKPSFFPEHSGKMRKLTGHRRWHAKNFAHRNPVMNLDMLFAPAHDALPGAYQYFHDSMTQYQGTPSSGWDDEPVEYFGSYGFFPLRSMSLMAGFREACFDGSLADVLSEGPWLEFENYCSTRSLNHNFHNDGVPGTNHLDHHKWVHITLTWKWGDGNGGGGGFNYTNEHELRIYVNGQLLPETSYTESIYSWAGSVYASGGRTPYFPLHSWAETANGTPVSGTVTQSGQGNDSWDEPPGNDGDPGFDDPPDNGNNGSGGPPDEGGGGEPPGNIGPPDGMGKAWMPFRAIECSYQRGMLHRLRPRQDGGTPKYWRANPFTLGECSYHGFPSVAKLGTSLEADARMVTSGSGETVYGFARNYSADMTFDEFYLWKGNSDTNLSNALSRWQVGRYYKPTWDSSSDATFVSGAINLNQASPARYLPPVSAAAPPEGGTTTVAATTIVPAVSRRRLLGVGWTWYAEAYDKKPTSFTPVMYDYQNPALPNPLFQTKPCVRVFILADGLQFPLGNNDGYSDDGFSTIVGSDGKPYTVSNPTDIHYKLWFQVQDLGFSSVLLATPVFDDITLYYDQGDVEYLLFAVMNTT